MFLLGGWGTTISMFLHTLKFKKYLSARKSMIMYTGSVPFFIILYIYLALLTMQYKIVLGNSFLNPQNMCWSDFLIFKSLFSAYSEWYVLVSICVCWIFEHSFLLLLILNTILFYSWHNNYFLGRDTFLTRHAFQSFKF